MGTNSSNSAAVASAYGVAWAHQVTAVQTWLANTSVATQVVIRGADDIEPAWGPQANAINWTDGYQSAQTAYYVDFGSCDGCASTATTGNGFSFVPCSTCNFTWNQYGVWKVSYGEPSALVMPEIYYTSQAYEWAAISDYGLIAHGPLWKVYFEGPLDEYDLATSTLTSAQAWTNFWNILNNNPYFSGAAAQTPPFSSQMHDTNS